MENEVKPGDEMASSQIRLPDKPDSENPRNGNDGSNASNAIALLLVLTQKRRRYRLTRWSTPWVETQTNSLRALNSLKKTKFTKQ